MTNVDGVLGNIYIKHNDKWHGDYYLTSNLTFSSDLSQAGKFYLLKSGDTSIVNGDRISIHLGNRTLILDNVGVIRLLNREQISHQTSSFIITNGSDNIDPITYESPIFFISDKIRKTALKYEWKLDIINPTHNDNSIINHKPHETPTITNDIYATSDCIYGFQFILERADNSIRNVEVARASANVNTHTKKINPDFFDEYKGTLLIILLIVILVLCIIASK